MTQLTLAQANKIIETMKEMACVVDQQNAGASLYKAIACNFERSFAFKAACDLVLKGRFQPNGYTEPVQHYWRRIAQSENLPG